MLTRITRAMAIVVALAGCMLAPRAQGAATEAQQLHAQAVLSFQHGRYAEAYGRFMALADAGHAPAAEVALFMYARVSPRTVLPAESVRPTTNGLAEEFWPGATSMPMTIRFAGRVNRVLSTLNSTVFT